MIDSSTSLLMKRLEVSLKKVFTQICNKDTKGDIVSVFQMPNNIEMLNEEEGQITQIKVPVENGVDVPQIKKGKMRGLKEPNQEIWREVFLDVSMQSNGKLSGSVGTFNIRKRMCNGILRFLYKNGLSILVKEVCLSKGTILRSEQDCKAQQFQLKTRKFVKIKKGGGTRLKKKAGKKVRKK